MADFENPTRKYKYFRPRQAFRGTANLTPTNLPSFALYHTGLNATVLIVRYWELTLAAAATVLTAIQRGVYGNKVMTGVGIVPETAAPAGNVNSLDTATAITGDASPAVVPPVYGWIQDYPFTVLQPGCSLIVQGQTVAQAARVTFFWEEILIDQLDFLYEL